MKKVFAPAFILLSLALSAGAGAEDVPVDAGVEDLQPMPELRIFQGDSACSATSRPMTGLPSYGRTTCMRAPGLGARPVMGETQRRPTTI
jgi:hypothetical protein